MGWTDDRFGTLSGRPGDEPRSWPYALALLAVCALLAAAAGLPSR